MALMPIRLCTAMSRHQRHRQLRGVLEDECRRTAAGTEGGQRIGSRYDRSSTCVVDAGAIACALSTCSTSRAWMIAHSSSSDNARGAVGPSRKEASSSIMRLFSHGILVCVLVIPVCALATRSCSASRVCRVVFLRRHLRRRGRAASWGVRRRRFLRRCRCGRRSHRGRERNR